MFISNNCASFHLWGNERHQKVSKYYENGCRYQISACQIELLFSVTRTYVKKLGTVNLFIQKLERLSFLFIIDEKKSTFHIFQF